MQQAYTARFNKRRVSNKRWGFWSIVRINAGGVYSWIYGILIDFKRFYKFPHIVKPFLCPVSPLLAP